MSKKWTKMDEKWAKMGKNGQKNDKNDKNSKANINPVFCFFYN
jgi:hypothetical protein